MSMKVQIVIDPEELKDSDLGTLGAQDIIDYMKKGKEAGEIEHRMDQLRNYLWNWKTELKRIIESDSEPMTKFKAFRELAESPMP